MRNRSRSLWTQRKNASEISKEQKGEEWEGERARLTTVLSEPVSDTSVHIDVVLVTGHAVAVEGHNLMGGGASVSHCHCSTKPDNPSHTQWGVRGGAHLINVVAVHVRTWW